MLHVFLLAQLASADHSSTAVVVQVITSLLTLALVAGQWVRSQSGKANERQIEPTQVRALTESVQELTDALNRLNRELGEVKTKCEATERDVIGLHQRVGGVSRDLAATTSRVDGLERREGRA